MSRIAIAICSIGLTMLGVSVVVFAILRLVPGDPISMMLPPGATEETRQNLERLYGMDKTLIEQYFIWLRDVLHLDFGMSTQFRLPVMEVIFNRLPVTLELVLLASIIALTLSFALSVLAVWIQRDGATLIIDGASGLTQAIPDFLWALIFIFFVTLYAPSIPISGRYDPRNAQDFITGFYLIEALITLRLGTFAELLRHAILPAFALALPLAASITRLLKSALEEAMSEDYAILARTKGKSRIAIILGEALRNALIPVIALTSVQLAFLIGGTVLIERLFSLPGIGSTAITAVVNRDLPLIQGVVLVFAALFIAINLISNGLYRLADPRLGKN
ncbi:MAG: ABC transporter permease [Roseovarius sp.]|nr:ABC transporter permease [Roseovarius sp.]